MMFDFTRNSARFSDLCSYLFFVVLFLSLAGPAFAHVGRAKAPMEQRAMSGVPAAQAQQAVRDNYRWSGELVSFDAAAKAATVKARTVDSDAIASVRRP